MIHQKKMIPANLKTPQNGNYCEIVSLLLNFVFQYLLVFLLPVQRICGA